MRLFASFAMLLVFAIGFTGCGSTKVKYDAVKVEGGSKLKTSVLWLKNKRDMIDIRAEFKNESEGPITIDTSAVKLSFEGQKGIYDSGTDPIRVAKGETVTKVIHFAFKPEVKKTGNAELVIDPIQVDLGKNKTRKETVKMKLPVEG